MKVLIFISRFRIERSQLRWFGNVSRMPQERLSKQILGAEVSGKMLVERPRTRWLDDIEDLGLEPFRISSKRNAVCVGGSRVVAALSGTVAPATLQEKRVKKKEITKKFLQALFTKYEFYLIQFHRHKTKICVYSESLQKNFLLWLEMSLIPRVKVAEL